MVYPQISGMMEIHGDPNHSSIFHSFPFMSVHPISQPSGVVVIQILWMSAGTQVAPAAFQICLREALGSEVGLGENVDTTHRTCFE